MAKQNENETEVNLAPLPDDWPDQARELADTFLTSVTPSAQERKRIEEFCLLSLKYSHLENQVQGEILCEIPASLNSLEEAASVDILEEAALLAASERKTLEIEPGPVEYLADALDDRGIKIIHWPHPQGDYCGGFLFRELTGPALLVMTPPHSPLTNFILAHQYCHLLADNNPYENRYCSHGVTPVRNAMGLGGRTMEQAGDITGAEETTLAEARADMFARCFLLPEKHFRRTLADFGLTGAKKALTEQLDRLADLAFYYNVATPLVINRLLDLQLITLKQTKSLQQAFCSEPTRHESEAGLISGIMATVTEDEIASVLSRLPKRYLTLAIALLMKNQISKNQLEVLFDLDRGRLDRFLAWTEIPAGVLRAQRQKEKGEAADIPDDRFGGN